VRPQSPQEKGRLNPLVQLAIFAIVIAVAALIGAWDGAAIGFGVSCFSALVLLWAAR
jgi:hypothetical protein